ncbi:MAG: hypothetical protein ACR2K5_02155 [Pseudolabrys sp.]
MDNARYLLQQADLCLKVAKQLSDRAEAEKLHATATRYLARAMEMEAESNGYASEPLKLVKG